MRIKLYFENKVKIKRIQSSIKVGVCVKHSVKKKLNYVRQ